MTSVWDLLTAFCLTKIILIILIVIIGDTSFDCTEGNNGYDRFANLLSGFNIFHCDNFMLIKVTDLLISIML